MNSANDLANPSVGLSESLPTKREFTERVLDACRTIRVLRDPEAKFLADRPLQNSIWEKAVDEWSAYGAVSEGSNFVATPEQAKDCMVVLGWCAQLTKDEFALIWARSFGFGFQKIADSMGLLGSPKHTYQTARRSYLCSIDKVYEIAMIDLQNRR